MGTVRRVCVFARKCSIDERFEKFGDFVEVAVSKHCFHGGHFAEHDFGDFLFDGVFAEGVEAT